MIDDAPESLQRLGTTLREQGWQVSVATAGHQGLHRAQALLPSLIILDVDLPDMDGFAVCRLLQESPRSRDIPIIFVTAAYEDYQRLRGLEHGGVDYIVKPFLPAEVVARVRIHLQRSSRQQGPATSEPKRIRPKNELALRAAMSYITENLAALPSLADIAHAAGSHDKKLSAIFREHLGMTVFAWARQERLRQAGDWLTHSHMSITDIAEQVGFHSAASFTTAFRKRMGQTPGQYRRTLQESNLNSDPDAS